MNVDELREKIAAVLHDYSSEPPLEPCPVCQARTDVILAAVAELFTDEQVNKLIALHVALGARGMASRGDVVDEVGRTITALRRYARPE